MKVRLTSASFRQKINGEIHYYRRGDIFEISDVGGKRLLNLNSAVDLDSLEAVEPEAEEPEIPEIPDVVEHPDDADTPERPKNAADKPTWAAYYKAIKGTDPGKLTRDEIIAEVG